MEIEQLVSLETAVWEALVDGDPDADRHLLADDFVGLYPTGFADRDDHVTQLANGPTVASFELLETRMIALSASAVLLAYRAEYTRTGDDRSPEAMYVSSLWVLRDGRWVNVFSQDTAANGAGVV